MSRFTSDPEALIAKGKLMLEQASNFNAKVNEVYKIVEQMVTQDYISPEAKVIGNSIEGYRASLNNIPKIIRAYGEYCIKAGNETLNTQDTTASEVKF